MIRSSKLERPVIINRRAIRSRRRKRHRNKILPEYDDISFLGIVLRVGTILFFICCTIYVGFIRNRDDDINVKYQKHLEDKGDLIFISESGAEHHTTEVDDIFNVDKAKKDEFFLPEEASGDCYDIAESLPVFQENYNAEDFNNFNEAERSVFTFIRRAKAIRTEFAVRYGNEIKARSMLSRGLKRFTDKAEDSYIKSKNRENIIDIDDDVYEHELRIDIIVSHFSK